MEENLVIQQGDYIRTSGSDRFEVEREICNLYGSSIEQPLDCNLTTSGLNAIMITFFAINSLVKDKRVMLLADELYQETSRDITRWLVSVGWTVIRFDQTAITEHKPSVIYFETCSNPSGKNISWKIVKEASPECIIIADNTWLSPVVCNPFEHGCHVVVESGTKYLSGGRIIVGHVTSLHNHPSSKAISATIRLFGVHVSPIYCRMLLESLATLQMRVKSSLTRTRDLIKMLRGEKFYWSGDYLPSSVILFEIPIVHIVGKEWKNDFCSIVRECGINCEASYGKPHDSICDYVKKTSDGTGIKVRLSVGYDNKVSVATLYAQLCEIFSRL